MAVLHPLSVHKGIALERHVGAVNTSVVSIPQSKTREELVQTKGMHKMCVDYWLCTIFTVFQGRQTLLLLESICFGCILLAFLHSDTRWPLLGLHGCKNLSICAVKYFHAQI